MFARCILTILVLFPILHCHASTKVIDYMRSVIDERFDKVVKEIDIKATHQQLNFDHLMKWEIFPRNCTIEEECVENVKFFKGANSTVSKLCSCRVERFRKMCEKFPQHPAIPVVERVSIGIVNATFHCSNGSYQNATANSEPVNITEINRILDNDYVSANGTNDRKWLVHKKHTFVMLDDLEKPPKDPFIVELVIILCVLVIVLVLLIILRQVCMLRRLRANRPIEEIGIDCVNQELSVQNRTPLARNVIAPEGPRSSKKDKAPAKSILKKSQNEEEQPLRDMKSVEPVPVNVEDETKIFEAQSISEEQPRPTEVKSM